jgi:hypothetical protein
MVPAALAHDAGPHDVNHHRCNDQKNKLAHVAMEVYERGDLSVGVVIMRAAELGKYFQHWSG